MAGAAPDPRLDRFFLEADATPNPGGLPIGGQSVINLRNDHLQYAITWFALAIGIFAVYASRSHLAPKVRSFIDHLVEAGV